MTRKTRLIILFFCIACFLSIAPVLVLYSMGYRFDFEKIQLTLTGGIYVRTTPTADKITVDSKIITKPRLFSNDVFIQSLLPSNHTVLVEKVGYYDYFKTIPVQEERVTKLENILLFKKDILFEAVDDLEQSPFDTIIEKFLIKTNNLYYSDSPENTKITTLEKATPILKNIVDFYNKGNNIIWLGIDGFVYKADLSKIDKDTAINTFKITRTAIIIEKKIAYKVISNGENTLVLAGNKLLFLNNKTNTLDNFHDSVKNIKISSDGKNIIYYNDNNIYISPLSLPAQITTLYNSSEKITNCIWLNNYYIIFTAGDKIIISETDYRGEINTVTLLQTFKSPQIFFNLQTNKLYILTDKTLLLSERIIP